MKRILLFSMILSLGMIGYAQKGSLVTKEQKQIVQTAVFKGNVFDLGNLEQPGNATVGNYVKSEGFEVIGLSDYDLGSNAAVGNRVTTFADGTMAAVYTFGAAGTGPSFSNRGTGYNYYDGSDWGAQPTSAFESDRTGWPSHAAWGENGEIVVAHAWGGTVYTDGGLVISTRPSKGTGDWTESLFLGPAGFEGAAWPRVMTNGENNMNVHIIHALNAEYNGMTDALLYSRSTDGGATWDILHTQIDGTDADSYTEISADRYTFANTVGETVAFCFANTWYTDLVVMKSDNSGDDWEKIVVWEHPYPFFDWNTTITTDTLWAPDGGVDIALDADGKVHLAATLTRVMHEEAGDTYNFFPYGEGVIYWNEDRPAFEAENPHHALNAWDPEILVPDVDLIGWGQDMDGDDLFTIFNAPEGLYTYRTIGANTMPTISCGDNGEIAIAWAGISEIDVYNDEFNYRRIWTRTSLDNGESWTDHFNINMDITQSFDECVYPNLASGIDGSVNLVYQADYDVGVAVDSDHDYLENRFTSYFDTYVGLANAQESISNISVSQNYPNPATGNTRINVELPTTGISISLEVSNIVGQVVYTEDRGTANNVQNSFVIDVTNFTPGVYFYTVKANNNLVTHKMIVE